MTACFDIEPLICKSYAKSYANKFEPLFVVGYFFPQMDNSPDSVLYRKALGKASDIHKKNRKRSLSPCFDLFEEQDSFKLDFIACSPEGSAEA